MDRKAIRAKAEVVWDSFLDPKLPPVDIIEAALTQAHEEAEWREGVLRDRVKELEGYLGFFPGEKMLT